jgi:transposase
MVLLADASPRDRADAASPLVPSLKESSMAKRKKSSRSRAVAAAPGSIARSAHGTLRSYTLGALPILDRILQRMKLEEFLQEYLPREQRRSKLATARGLTVLVKNFLVAREPIYGLGEWAAAYAPDALGLSPEEVRLLNDDRAGRFLTRLFHSDRPSLLLALMRHIVREFTLGLDELHNDSTTVTFSGAYQDAAEEQRRRGQKTLAITWGYNKDHRPDLKQLLYILTISSDGGVPVHCRVASGNVTDDTTHRDTWELLCQLAGRKDFLYVADCKLATIENMNYIAQEHGRFVSVLPRTRSEDAAFRQRVGQGEVVWQHLWDKTDEEGQILDQFSVADTPAATPEGYHLWWFHSTRKAELDLAARDRRLRRAEQQLHDWQQKLRSPRSRQRDPGKVQEVVEAILKDCDVEGLIHVRIESCPHDTYRQQRRGRPGKDTVYVKETSMRLDLHFAVDAMAVARQRLTDGLFPLVTNDRQLSALEVLHAYKRQPQVEKRFEQLKTDYAVAPVFLKDVGRIEAFLCVYFFALLAEALLERELRRAMEREGLESLPLYPEGRDCRRPTTRRVIDVFASIQRHVLSRRGKESVVLLTELAPLHRKILNLLGVSMTIYL